MGSYAGMVWTPKKEYMESRIMAREECRQVPPIFFLFTIENVLDGCCTLTDIICYGFSAGIWRELHTEGAMHIWGPAAG